MPLVSAVNQIFSFLTVAGDVFIVLLFIGLALEYSGKNPGLMGIIKKNGLWLAFATALVSMLVSLFYSDIIGYEPCKLCWLARIFMYPQVFLLGMALWKKERGIADYSIVLSVIGAAISGYQLLLQFGITSAAPCAATAVSCTKIYFEYFGYVTIPVMAFTAFLLMIGFVLAFKFSQKN
jgi:disulfide bond formation protein DsbB